MEHCYSFCRAGMQRSMFILPFGTFADSDFSAGTRVAQRQEPQAVAKEAPADGKLESIPAILPISEPTDSGGRVHLFWGESIVEGSGSD